MWRGRDMFEVHAIARAWRGFVLFMDREDCHHTSIALFADRGGADDSWIASPEGALFWLRALRGALSITLESELSPSPTSAETTPWLSPGSSHDVSDHESVPELDLGLLDLGATPWPLGHDSSSDTQVSVSAIADRPQR